MLTYFTTTKDIFNPKPEDVTIRWDSERREFHVFITGRKVVVMEAPHHELFRPEYDAQLIAKNGIVWKPMRTDQ